MKGCPCFRLCLLVVIKFTSFLLRLVDNTFWLNSISRAMSIFALFLIHVQAKGGRGQ